MTESTANKPTILVVDDSRLMRVAARKILKDDFEILEAEDGEVAWDLLQDNAQITLVMSDLSMPNLDGLGLLRKMRESSAPHLNALPVIIVTGAEDDDGSKNTALAAGASDFITKPFESVQLLARAQAQAKQQRTQQALQDSEASKQQLEETSSVDALTGLANQRAFNDHVEEALSYAIRHRTELTLLLVQVEKYKVLFLRRGKQTAEELLRRLGRLLSEGRRREDTVARVGLDTFGILLPSANPIGARRVAEQLHEAIAEQDFDISDEPLVVTTSIAVTSPAIHAETRAEHLLADASEKLKIAQQAGGNRVQYSYETGAFEQPRQPVQETAATVDTPTPAPAVASITEVHQALHTLSTGAQPDKPADELARAVLPLLDAWNQAHGNNYSALLDQLKSALQVTGCNSTETETTTTGSTIQSL